jgi:hypothetical protein
MGFKINHRKRVAKLLGLEIHEVNELLNRMNGHFRKNGIDNDEIARSFFILGDIQTKKETQRIKFSVPLLDFKHKGIINYRVKIVTWRDKGFSAEYIAKRLKAKEDAPSLSTIKRYLKAVSDWRKNNG